MQHTPLTLEEVQAVTLDILVHIDAFCRERGIAYSLGYGSALGAVRHGGFIPWDDDVDLVMRREEYERFLGEFSDPTGRYVCLSFEAGTYPYPFAKIVDTHTVQQPANMKPVANMGIGVDIFPYDTFRGEDTARILKQKARASAVFKRLRYTRYNSLSEVNAGRFLPVHTLFYLWCNLWGTKFYRNKLLRRMRRMRGEGPYVGLCASMETDIRKIYDRDLFDSLVECEFAGHRFFLFADAHRYLCGVYGDSYMTPPPPEKRIAHIALSYFKEEGEAQA